MNDDLPYSERRIIVTNKKKKDESKFHRFVIAPIDRMTDSKERSSKRDRLQA